MSCGASDLAEVFARSTRQTLTLFTQRTDVGRLLFDSGLPVDRFLSACVLTCSATSCSDWLLATFGWLTSS